MLTVERPDGCDQHPEQDTPAGPEAWRIVIEYAVDVDEVRVARAAGDTQHARNGALTRNQDRVDQQQLSTRAGVTISRANAGMSPVVDRAVPISTSAKGVVTREPVRQKLYHVRDIEMLSEPGATARVRLAWWCLWKWSAAELSHDLLLRH